MMNVLSVTIAKSFIDAYVSVTIQLSSSVQYHLYCTEECNWMVTETYACTIDKRFGYCNRAREHSSKF